MKIKKNLVFPIAIFVILCLNSISFSANIGRSVYGLLTETYNGMAVGDSTKGADSGAMEGSGYDSSDKIEGSKSYSIGYQYWFGVCFDNVQNMSVYSGGRLYFSAKMPSTVDISNSGNAFNVKDSSLTDNKIIFNSSSIIELSDGSSGIENDGNWHSYYISLDNFVGLGLDLTSIKYPFIVSSVNNDNTILIDNVYWTKSATGSFSVTVKNISDDVAVDSVTWSQSAFRQNWVAAEQYLELDLDQYTPEEDGEGNKYSWHVEIYLDNGSAEKNGLYADYEVNMGTYTATRTSVLQMCWRISRTGISSPDTVQISKSGSPNYALYDGGRYSSDPYWYPWVYMKELKETFSLNYITVWNLSGCHTFAGANDAYDSFVDEWGYVLYTKTPRIYLGADFANSLGGLIYNANVVTELVYE